LLVALVLWPVTRAQWQANLGAVAQARAELSVYAWPQYPVQDAVRLDPAVDLAPAIAHYQRALELNPNNATAHRRLGQILLSRGDYEAATEHLMQAYAAAPGQRATRQLLGEALAVSGRVEDAAVVWATVHADEEKFRGRRWWYESQGKDQEARWIGAAYRRSRAAMLQNRHSNP
jgi:tetratricopeptide (TPR) repeat protein